ncbi:putative signal transducing protein [Diplocloster modestus]|uniref:DUF2007 domain-containing protein n=1 Tax=Diplocloster modestus TaxID=2850322 RepID=A0ABS6KD58_9FIRM|nr:DUF2007 domain-containing protein [Diplocloster modestus]MBU9728444.1 DUF2007 domain-containing protein [Diplocloster modestus]
MRAMREVKIYSAEDRVQADIILEVLKKNDIPAFRQGLGSGGIMDIYGGNSIYGEDIIVDSDDVERALEVLRTIGICEPE